MKTKILFFIISATLAVSLTNAQSKFGLKGAFNSSNETYNTSGKTDDSKRLGNFQAGLVADINIAPLFYVRTGVDVQGKGTRNKFAVVNNNTYSEITTRPIYVEVPVNFLLKLPIAPGARIYLGGGPYVAVGVAGKNKLSTYVNGNIVSAASVEKDIEWGNDDPLNNNSGDRGEYKRFDAGANLLTGIEFGNRFGINLQYGIGLVNTIPGQTNDKNKHRVLSLGATIFF